MAVSKRRCVFEGKAYFVRVAANRSDALDTEVEWLDGETCRLEEGHNEASEAAVDVQTNLVLGSELSERDNVVLVAVREVYCGTNELHAGSACRFRAHMVCLY